MKKIITLLLSLVCLLGMLTFPATAEENQVFYYQTEEGTLKVFISLENGAYGSVQLTVFDKEGYDEATFASLSDGEKEALIKFIGTGKAEGGKAEFEVEINGDTGFYPYTVSTQYNNNVISGEKFAYNDEESDILTNINNKSVAELEAYFDVNFELLFKNTGIYNESLKTKICTAMANTSYNNIDDAFNAAFKVSLEDRLSNSQNADKLIILSSYTNVLAYDKPEYKIFLNASDTFKNDVVSLIENEFTAEKFYEAVDLTELKNTGNYTEVNPILTRLSESTSIDLTDYFDLSNTSSVDDELVGADAKDADELIKLVSDAIKAAKGGGSGGSSVSGGIKSSKSSASLYVPSQDKTTDDTAAFSDLDGYDWAKPAVKVLAENGILNGKSKTEFAPSDLVSREELVKMLVCIFDIYDETAETKFSDLSGHWSASYVASAEKYGLVQGVSENIFGKGAALTREDMAVLCYRFMNAFGVKLETAETEDFADVKQISDYAKEAVKVLKGANVINGRADGTFAPKDGCNRAEAAKVVYYIYTAKNK